MTDLASNQIQRLRGEVWMLSRVTNSATGTISRYDAALSGLMAGGILMAVSKGIFSFAEANNELNETLIRTRNNTAMATTAVGKTVVSFGEYRDAVMKISDDTGAAADTIAEGFQHAY